MRLLRRRWHTPAWVVLSLGALCLVLAGLMVSGPGGGAGRPVPNVVGKTLAAAEATLYRDGFAVGLYPLEHGLFCCHVGVRPGRVMSQEPAAGTPAATGAVVIDYYPVR